MAFKMKSSFNFGEGTGSANSPLKGWWKDKVQQFADYASYVPGPIGKVGGMVSGGIDAYDAYKAYKAGDMDTYRAEKNKALQTLLLSGTGGNIVKAGVKGAGKLTAKQIAKQKATKAAGQSAIIAGREVGKEVLDKTILPTDIEKIKANKLKKKSTSKGLTDIVDSSTDASTGKSRLYSTGKSRLYG